MLFMQKERNISEYIDFITYQDDAIYQCPIITEEEDNRIRTRRETFIRETGTEVLITMITSYGLAPGGCKTLSPLMVVFIRELTSALFDNTFVTDMDDFSIRQIHNILTNSYLQKEYIKEE